jgi:hypothetical protein
MAEVDMQSYRVVALVALDASGWASIRRITAEDNYRARSFYDRISARTVFLTYEMKL